MRNPALGVRQPNPKACSYQPERSCFQDRAPAPPPTPPRCLQPQLILHSMVSWGSFKSIPSLNPCKEFSANLSRVSCSSKSFPRLVESLRFQKSRCSANPSVPYCLGQGPHLVFIGSLCKATFWIQVQFHLPDQKMLLCFISQCLAG